MGIVVVGTSRSQEKLKKIEGLGEAIWVQEGDFYGSLQGKVDAVIDFIGAAYLEQNLRALKSGGSMIILGLLGGSRASINLGLLLVKKIKMFGSTLRSRCFESKVALVDKFSVNLFALFEDGTLKPQIDRVLDWTAVDAAHTYMEKNQNIGKLVLRVTHSASEDK